MRTRALVLLALTLAACAHRPTPKQLDSMRDELLAMRDADQEVRRRWIKDRENKALLDEMKAVDAQNVARLETIIQRIGGWPGASLVGMKASGAAWTVAQHAPAPLLHQLLPLMEKAVKTNDLAGALYATSVDRVRIQDGQKQLYGSQFDTNNGRCEPLPIEDPEHVEDRRKAIGLDPLDEYTKQLCEAYGAQRR